MENRRQLADHFSARIEQVQAESDKRSQQDWNDIEELKKLRDANIRGIITEEKLLSKTVWNVEINNHDNIFLRASDQSRDESLKPLADLIETDHHCSFKLEDGITIYFSDYDVSISFGKPTQVSTFVTKHELKLNTAILDNTIEQRQALVDGLRATRGLIP